MDRRLLAAFGGLALALSVPFASDTKAQTCNQPTSGAAGNSVAYAWGGNFNGQLGDGTAIERHDAVRVQNLSGLLTVAGGSAHSLALKNDLAVWAWGLNSQGQLGDGTAGISRIVPVQVQNITGVIAIAGGFMHSLALKNDGTVWAWGWNMFGQLGDGTNTDRHTPVQVRNLSGVTAIATTNGGNHNLALKSDGTLWAWGDNFFGQLGDGSTVHRSAPVQVQNLSGVTCMAAGSGHSLALLQDGTVRAWGQNVAGALGDGTTIDRLTPVQVQNLNGVQALAAGIGFSLALKSNATVWAWGTNDFGQLGDGTNNNHSTPVQVSTNVSGVIAIAAGESTAYALRSDAIVQAWGDNSFGQLGDGTTVGHPFAVQVAGLVENLNDVTAIAGGGSHGLVVGTPLTLLTVHKILVHPDPNHRRLFNIRIDGVVVKSNVGGGKIGPIRVDPGSHKVSESAGWGTAGAPITAVISGDCAEDGTVNLAMGDNKSCTITNYDNAGGCASGLVCEEPGDGVKGCLKCSRPHR
jgi:alpha-tubulin suppressor-like RCC1 family protein